MSEMSKMSEKQAKKTKRVSLAQKTSKIDELKTQVENLKKDYSKLFDEKFGEFENTKFEFGTKQEAEKALEYLNIAAPWQYSDLIYLKECTTELKSEIKEQAMEKAIKVKNRVAETLNRFLQKQTGVGYKGYVGDGITQFSHDDILNVFTKVQDCLQKTNSYRLLFKTLGDNKSSIMITLNHLEKSLENQVDNFDVKEFIMNDINIGYPEQTITDQTDINNRALLINILNKNTSNVI